MLECKECDPGKIPNLDQSDCGEKKEQCRSFSLHFQFDHFDID